MKHAAKFFVLTLPSVPKIFVGLVVKNGTRSDAQIIEQQHM